MSCLFCFKSYFLLSIVNLFSNRKHSIQHQAGSVSLFTHLLSLFDKYREEACWVTLARCGKSGGYTVIFSAVIALQSNHPKQKQCNFFFFSTHTKKRKSRWSKAFLKFFNVRLSIAYRIRQRKVNYKPCKNCAS